MNPRIFIFGTLLFILCLAAHILLWRIRIPKRDALVLFFIFLAVPVFIFLFLAGPVKLHFSPPVSGAETVFIFLLHLSLSLVYVSSYPAAQAISPSLDILLGISAAREKRMTEEDILGRYNDAELVTARIDDLRTSVLVAHEGDNFQLTRIGKAVIVFFIVYRKILGLPLGEG